MRKIILSLFVCSLASVLWGQTVPAFTGFSHILEQKIQASRRIQRNPAWGRLVYMRFYSPSNTVHAEEGFWKKLLASSSEEQERAVAFYLFNMYVSTASYKEYVPQTLTLDYLGVLDRISLIKGFDVRNAEKFYLEHKEQIKTYLQELFASHSFFPVYHTKNEVNDIREMEFMRLLSQAPLLGGKPSYLLPVSNRLQTTAFERDINKMSKLLRQAIADGIGKIVTFETPQLRPEDIDGGGLSPRTPRTVKTYRYANEECTYCSYLFGRQVCETVAAAKKDWGSTRVYKIIARTEEEEFLKSSSPNGKFIQADGTVALKWRYHTATLVVVNLSGEYTPLVADKFLAGEQAILLTDWLQKFSKDTIFFAVPFFRKQEMENSFKVPQQIVGDKVIIEGTTYTPHPVLP